MRGGGAIFCGDGGVAAAPRLTVGRVLNGTWGGLWGREVSPLPHEPWEPREYTIFQYPRKHFTSLSWCGPDLSTAISSSANSSTLGSSNPVSSTIKFLISLFCSEYNTT